jgi:hypothetical protein
MNKAMQRFVLTVGILVIAAGIIALGIFKIQDPEKQTEFIYQALGGMSYLITLAVGWYFGIREEKALNTETPKK